ncbi:MAG: ParB/RepB/Spo0J family partition protein [Oscillospiraceae bacterium]|nr:ParB/RepB/Spo0J family partition protein [Oscillospiraceae bacterium]
MALGTGIDALFDDNFSGDENVQTLKMSEIEPNKNQPRRTFNEEALNELADSIREHGLIQPIIVRPAANGMTYEIVAGERRWKASRIAGLTEVPVIIRNVDDEEMSKIALIENIQRENLNPIEEAAAYKDLTDKYGMTHEELSKTIGKSRSYVSNMLRLLSLPEYVSDKLSRRELSVGHAKALLGLEDAETIENVARKVVSDHLNVRQTEKMVSESMAEDAPARQKKVSLTYPYYVEMEAALKEALGRGVKITGNGEKGKITLEFYDDDDLRIIADALIGGEE